MALSAAVESSPSADVASGMAKKVSPSQGAEKGSTKVVIPLEEIFRKPQSVSVSPASHVSPREGTVSPHSSLKGTHGGEGTVPSPSSVRRRGDEAPSIPFESPRNVGESPQRGGEETLVRLRG